jgi:hypothetical protein
MIAAAIGKPMAKATAIVDVIAKSRSSSGCTLSSSDMAYSTNRKTKKPSPDEAATAFWLTVSRSPEQVVLEDG